MGIASLLIGLGILVLVTVLVIAPLLDEKRVPTTTPDKLSTLREERYQVVLGIRELDMDYRTQKIKEADYRVLRLSLIARGAALLKQEEALPPESDEADREIESAVAVIRERVYLCAVCNKVLRKGDKFCAHCGASIGTPNAAT